MKYLFLLLFFFDKINAQSNISAADSLSPKFYQQHQLTNHPDFRSSPFIELKVIETDSTNTQFSDNLGRIGYCGDIEGGIKYLLQNDLLFSTSHIRFLNQPSRKRYVLFYALGVYINRSPVGEPISRCFLDNSVMVRDIILKMMATEYRFDVKGTKDSLEVIELKIKDNLKLGTFLTPHSQRFVGGSAKIDAKTREFNSVRSPLLFIMMDIGRNWNVLTYDETNTADTTSYTFTIPSGLLDSIDKYDELNTYLEQNLGITLIKTKRLEKTYTIEFKNE